MSRWIVTVPPSKVAIIEQGKDKRRFVAVDDLRLWLAECEIANADIEGAKVLARLLREQLAVQDS